MKTEFVNVTNMDGHLMQQYAQKMLWTYKKTQIIVNGFSMVLFVAVGIYCFAVSPKPLFDQADINLSIQAVLGVLCFLLAIFAFLYLLKLMVLDNIRAQKHLQAVEGKYPKRKIIINDEGIYVYQGDNYQYCGFDQVVDFLETDDLGIMMVQEQSRQTRGIPVQKNRFGQQTYGDFKRYFLEQVLSAKNLKS